MHRKNEKTYKSLDGKSEQKRVLGRGTVVCSPWHLKRKDLLDKQTEQTNPMSMSSR